MLMCSSWVPCARSCCRAWANRCMSNCILTCGAAMLTRCAWSVFLAVQELLLLVLSLRLRSSSTLPATMTYQTARQQMT
jgi:hypothetical protein